MEKTEIDHTYTEEVVCPYCGYQHFDSWEMTTGDMDCESCDKEFHMERNVKTTYCTSQNEV